MAVIELVAHIVCAQLPGTLGQDPSTSSKGRVSWKDRQPAKQMRTFMKLKEAWRLSRVNGPQRFLLANAGHGNEIKTFLTEACSTVDSWCLLQAQMLR